MARQIKRFGPVVLVLAVVCVSVILPFAQSDPPADGPGDPGGPPVPIPINPELACSVRAAVGFGPSDVLPAMAGDQHHRQMIGAAISFCAADEEQMAALVADRQEAHIQLVHALTWDEDTESIYGQLAAAHGVLAEAADGMLPVLCQGLPADQAGHVNHVCQNLALDPELRTLAFTAEQRAAITAAQRERDAVTKNARYWYQKVRRQEANDAYGTTLQSILTEDQSAKLASNRELLAARMEEMAAAEANADATG